MLEDIETFEITTPEKGHIVVLKAWITGRDKQKIDGSLFKGVQTSGAGNSITPQLSENMIANQENASIESVIVSVDGDSVNVLDRVLDMRVRDFDFVTKEIKKIVDGDLPEKKEINSETNTTESSEQEKDISQIAVGQ